VDSDARWKEDISGTYGLDLVNAIPAHSFKWRENSGRADGVRHQGFIAQEFQQRLLELGISDKDLAVVKYDSENDEYGLATGELIPILWRAIQQLSAKVAALEAA
jgi:3-mercaptopyruvate sulfurtransferase SseA